MLGQQKYQIKGIKLNFKYKKTQKKYQTTETSPETINYAMLCGIKSQGTFGWTINTKYKICIANTALIFIRYNIHSKQNLLGYQ